MATDKATSVSAGEAGAWRDVFFEVARTLGCLASSFPDGNPHVLAKAASLSSPPRPTTASDTKLVAAIRYFARHIAYRETAHGAIRDSWEWNILAAGDFRTNPEDALISAYNEATNE